MFSREKNWKKPAWKVLFFLIFWITSKYKEDSCVHKEMNISKQHKLKIKKKEQYRKLYITLSVKWEIIWI